MDEVLPGSSRFSDQKWSKGILKENSMSHQSLEGGNYLCDLVNNPFLLTKTTGDIHGLLYYKN